LTILLFVIVRFLKLCINGENFSIVGKISFKCDAWALFRGIWIYGLKFIEFENFKIISKIIKNYFYFCFEYRNGLRDIGGYKIIKIS